MLPPLNDDVSYSDLIFTDLFAFVSVPETAIKGLFYLSKNGPACREMLEGGVSLALEKMLSDPFLSRNTKSKYAENLYMKLIAFSLVSYDP